ncbi:hypothetical protein [Streptomyces sp. NPDC001820]|uniref:hypothetical protein n=1 Tax=Streptomyces sp. NPDC001820 TaxID=3364613 RepID=UPI0036796AB7
MIGAAVFAGLFALAFFAFALVDHRKLWWHFQAGRPGRENEGSWGPFINPRLQGPGEDPIAVLASKSGDVERYDVDGSA